MSQYMPNWQRMRFPVSRKARWYWHVQSIRMIPKLLANIESKSAQIGWKAWWSIKCSCREPPAKDGNTCQCKAGMVENMGTLAKQAENAKHPTKLRKTKPTKHVEQAAKTCCTLLLLRMRGLCCSHMGLLLDTL